MKKNPPPTYHEGVGALVPYLSPKAIKNDLLIVYQNLGGAARLEHEANRDPESYRWFMGMIAKLIPREVAVQHSADGGLEAMLDKLDRGENAAVINGEFTEVEDAAEK